MHHRLLAGDELATAEIAEIFLPALTRQLTAMFPNVTDPHTIATAVEDALISYFQRPRQFDSSRLGLFSYLRMAARGDLLNSIRSSKVVELTLPDSEHVLETLRDPADIEEVMVKGESPLLREVNELLKNRLDRALFALMADGVRETAEYAELLGITGRPVDEQAAIVKRNKDRLKRSLQRKMKRTGNDG